MLTTEQKAAINEIAVWKPIRFPNGSAYRQQCLPIGRQANGLEIKPNWFNYCYYNSVSVSFPSGETVQVSMHRVSVGPGTDFGKYFCSRDQALVDLL